MVQWRGSQLEFIYMQLFQVPKLPSQLPYSLEGRTGIIVGATAGLGLSAAQQLLSLGLTHLIIGARDIPRGEAAAAKIQPMNPKAKVEVWQIDLFSYESTVAFVQRAERELARIDFVILGAAIAAQSHRLIDGTGHETDMQTNVYSTNLAALLFTPILAEKYKASPSSYKDGYVPHLTIVSSDVHTFVPAPATPANPEDGGVLARYDDKEYFNFMDQYSFSKLFEVYFHQYLVHSVLPAGTDYPVIINSLNPGLCTDTDLIREATGLAYVQFRVMRALLAWRGSVGARTYLDAAVVKGKESQGKYLSSNRVHTFRWEIGTEDGKKVQRGIWEDLSRDWKKHGVDVDAVVRRIQAIKN